MESLSIAAGKHTASNRRSLWRCLRWTALSLTLFAPRASARTVPNGHEAVYFTAPTGGSSPTGITVAPDGSIWFTEPNTRKIAAGRRDGFFRDFDVPLHSSRPALITNGPDGNLWFTASDASAIGRVTLNSDISLFPTTNPTSLLAGITGGPDGNVWFTEYVASGEMVSANIGRIRPGGTISEFPVDYPAFILTRGPDNALWYTSRGVGRISTNGMSHEFDVGNSSPFGITAGPDGALWYTRRSPAGVSVITTAGAWTDFADMPDGEANPVLITRGPDDNLWFTTDTGGIWRLNLAGTMVKIVGLDETDKALDITADLEHGDLWFTMPNANSVGRVSSLGYLSLNVPFSGARGFARGPNGTVWYADADGDRIGRISANGALFQQELGQGTHEPIAIAPAPDGTAWFTDQGANSPGGLDFIGHFVGVDQVVEFAIPSPPSGPEDIVRGPDGNYWFTEYDAGSIGRITPQGVINRFPIPVDEGAVSQPQNIAVGPDGNLWFTDQGTNSIGRMTTQGQVVEFPVPTEDALPAGIAAGADGNLYFTEANAGRVGRITTAGVITELGVPAVGSAPQFITLGPDGAMWFTETFGNRLGRIAPDGRITHFDLPDADSFPSGIVGNDSGRLYYGLPAVQQIGFVDLAAAEPTRTATPTEPPGSTATPTRTPGSPLCVGDCGGEGSVSTADLLDGIEIALGRLALFQCTSGDENRDGVVRIDELIVAVSNHLQGCVH